VLLFVPVFIMSLLVFLAFSPSKLPDTPSTSVWTNLGQHVSKAKASFHADH
jgi:hypothetical protein